MLSINSTDAGWAAFARVFLVYALVPPAAAAFASRLLGLWSLWRVPSIGKM